VIELPIVPKGTLYRDEAEKTSLETRNGVIQARFVFYKITQWTDGDQITPELLLEFQRLAVNQIYRCAGHFRDDRVTIRNSAGEILYEPPNHTLIPELVEEMCNYVNQNWTTKTPIHLSAYAMWRLNWIHPFFGGNGRTARAFSYLVLCIGLQFAPPANQKTIPQLIEENRQPYTTALREADKAWADKKLDLTAMETLLSDLLAIQLVFLHEAGTGVKYPPSETDRGSR
jgi:Fic family protein